MSKVMKTMRLQHEFCEFVPGNLKPGTLYISMEYGTAVHLCVCGCGQKVVTPLSPTDWKLIYDGDTVSLDPSIGNWSFDCQSHYWIKKNQVIVSKKWNDEEIEENRLWDKKSKKHHYQGNGGSDDNDEFEPKSGLIDYLKNIFRR